MANSKRKSHCNKATYDTFLGAQIAAEVVARKMMQKANPILTHVHAYKCEYCPKYHIGRDKTQGINWKALESYERRRKEKNNETKPFVSTSSP